MEIRRLLFVHTARGIGDRTAESAFSHISGYEVKSLEVRELTEEEIAGADAIFVMTDYQKKMLQKTKGVAKEKMVVLGIQCERYNIERAKTLEWDMMWDRNFRRGPSWLWDDDEDAPCGCGGKTLWIDGEVVCQNCGASWKDEKYWSLQ